MPPRAVKTVPNHRVELVPSGNLLSQAVDVSKLRYSHMKVVIYGQNRVGKTVLACQFPKPLLLLSFEPEENGGARSVTDIEGVKFIKVESSRHALELAQELQSDKYFESVVLDSATSYQDLFLQELMGLSKLPETLSWGTVSDTQYRQRSEKVKEGMRPFLALKKHTVVTAKEKDHRNKTGEDRSKSMKSKLVRVNEVLPDSYIAEDLGGAAAMWLNDACDITRLTISKEVQVVKSTVELLGQTQEVEESVETGRNVHRLWVKWRADMAGGLRTPFRGCPEFIEEEDPEKMYRKLHQILHGEV